MTKLLKVGILLFAFVWMAGTVQAQKFGYMNSQALLAEMSEVKQARTNLETLEKQLRSKGQGMLTSLQTQYQEIQQQVQEGRLSPKQQEEAAAKLKGEEAKIGKFEQEMMQQIQKKEAELLQPILDKVNNAIKDVATENGYAYIFDISTSILLYADENSDVSALVKTKLGL